MIAGQVRCLAASFHAKLLGEPNSFMAAGTGDLRDVLRRDGRIRIVVRLDGVNAVAVGTNRSLPVALRDGRSVDALLKLLGNHVVAAPAGHGHIELEDRGLRVLRVKNLVSAMAVGADRSLLRAGSDGMSMHALFVGGDHLRALAAVFHYEFLTVAGAASRRNVGVVDPRLRIARGQLFLRTTVTVNAVGRVSVASLGRAGMETALVGSLLVGMATGTRDL